MHTVSAIRVEGQENTVVFSSQTLLSSPEMNHDKTIMPHLYSNNITPLH